MGEKEPRARLYLVRHGEAKSKQEDPERGLTDAGRADVEKVAAWAVAVGIRARDIRHSGKLRAEQTANILAAHLGTEARAVSGLAPNDDVHAIAKAISAEKHDVVLVGHLPFLERLASLLISSGDADCSRVSLDAGALLELAPAKEEWVATCLMPPGRIPGSRGAGG